MPDLFDLYNKFYKNTKNTEMQKDENGRSVANRERLIRARAGYEAGVHVKEPSRDVAAEFRAYGDPGKDDPGVKSEPRPCPRRSGAELS